MRININKWIYGGLLALFLLPVAISCEKDKIDEEFVPERMFTPAAINIALTNSDAILSWNRSLFAAGQETYTLEVSTDSMFQSTAHISVEIDSLRYIVAETDVVPGTKYFARLRANATESSEASHWVYSESFIITGQVLLLPVEPGDLAATSVTLKWDPGVVTHIMLNGVRHDITPAEAAAREKTITGLTEKTEYEASLFNNTLTRGMRDFRTRAMTPTGPLVVVLGANDSLGAMLKTAVDGNIFVLPQGSQQFYNDPITLPAGISVTIFGEDVPEKPVVALNGITLPATAGTITFENVDITGYQENDETKSKRNYIFNQSAATATDQVIFENCIVRNFTNTPFRIQSSNPITINKVVFSRCVVYDCGDNGANGTYAMIHSNVATGKVNNIEITNSTIYKIGYSIILHNSAPSQSVLIENCTFYNVVGNGRYFVDYNAQSAGSFTVRNCIIGKTLSPAESSRGIRAGSSYTVDNTYKTADAIISSNPITNIIDYPQNSTELWANPASGDFTIIDNTFPGRTNAGDPRWRP